jgi:hypothetical protein
MKKTAAIKAPDHAVERGPSTFIDNGDGTVTDSATHLTWSKETLSNKCVTHATAEKTCAGLDLAGHSDWRLPTRKELNTLVDDTRFRPAIDVEAFPDTKSDWYWTATLYASSSDYAWCVNFNSGLVDGSHRGSYGAFVRAVRSVPAGQ